MRLKMHLYPDQGLFRLLCLLQPNLSTYIHLLQLLLEGIQEYSLPLEDSCFQVLLFPRIRRKILSQDLQLHLRLLLQPLV